jgi:hypothetical protein
LIPVVKILHDELYYKSSHVLNRPPDSAGLAFEQFTHGLGWEFMCVLISVQVMFQLGCLLEESGVKSIA